MHVYAITEFCSSARSLSFVRDSLTADVVAGCVWGWTLATMNERQGAECPVCLESFDAQIRDLIARLLSCGHSICTGCAGRLPVQNKTIRYGSDMCI
mgnify:CR=1 FL=1